MESGPAAKCDVIFVRAARLIREARRELTSASATPRARDLGKLRADSGCMIRTCEGSGTRRGNARGILLGSSDFPMSAAVEPTHAHVQTLRSPSPLRGRHVRLGSLRCH